MHNFDSNGEDFQLKYNSKQVRHFKDEAVMNLYSELDGCDYDTANQPVE